MYVMFVLSGVTLPLNSGPAHVDSGNNYTHVLTVVTRLYFSFTEPGYEASDVISIVYC